MSIFSKIIAGDIPCYKIYEDEYTFAFLDINPYRLWHTLVVPKIEIDKFTDVPEPYYSAVFQTAKKLALAIQQATGTKRIGTRIVGFDVPHFHYHLVPINTLEEFNQRDEQPVSPEIMKQIQQKIISYIS